MRKTLSISEAAFALKISVVSLRKYADTKKIFATRNAVNGWRRFYPSEVERFSKVLDGVSRSKYQKPTATEQ